MQEDLIPFQPEEVRCAHGPLPSAQPNHNVVCVFAGRSNAQQRRTQRLQPSSPMPSPPSSRVSMAPRHDLHLPQGVYHPPEWRHPPR